MKNKKLDFTNPAMVEAKKYIVKNTYVPKGLKDYISIQKDKIVFQIKTDNNKSLAKTTSEVKTSKTN